MLVNLILHSGANAPVLEKRKAKICECFEGERRKLSMDFRCLSEKVFHPHQITFHRMSEWVKMEEGCGRRHRQLRFQTFIMCVFLASSKTQERDLSVTLATNFISPTNNDHILCVLVCVIHSWWLNKYKKCPFERKANIYECRRITVFSYLEARAKKSGSKKVEVQLTVR